MRAIKLLLCAASLPLILAAGCGGNNTYNPNLINLTPDFVITVFKGAAATVGNGQGLTPNSQANPVGVDVNGSAPVTVVLSSQGGFTGTVTLSNGSPTGDFTVDQPSPTSVTVPAGGFANAQFTVTPADASVGETGTVVVTATSGGITHTQTIYFKVNAPAPDLSVAAYVGTPGSVGDGSESTPITAANPAVVPFSGALTITVVVKSVNGFSGTAAVTIPASTGPYAVTQPSPSSVTISSGGFADTSFTVTQSRKRGTTSNGNATVHVTSGTITKDLIVYFTPGGAN